MASKGLILLDEAHRVPPKIPKMYLSKGLVHGSYFYLADKPSGVEPGFLAVEINEDFSKRAEQFFKRSFSDEQDCKAYLNSLNKEASKESKDQMSLFVNQLLQENQKKQSPPTLSPLKLFLFKQDYHEPNAFGRVAPPLRRLENTHAIKKRMRGIKKMAALIYAAFRRTRSSKENTNAIQECLANDIAVAFGMPTQTQHLVFGTYKNGHPKILTACVWEKNLTLVEGRIAGSKVKENYENYLIECDANNAPLIQNGLYKSDTRLTNLGECLALFISQGDRDVFGSQGQNKGFVGDRLFGFDFGHAYRANNPILKTLKDDFTFVQPSDKTEKFKNLSICYDSLMSERMSGLFFIYKMMGDELNFTPEETLAIERALEQYKRDIPGFANRYAGVKANCIATIFDEYYFKFKDLADKEKNKNHKAEYLAYAKRIKEAKAYAIQDNKHLLRIFKNKMQLGPREVDLLDNLSKLTAETSSFSSSGEVALKHLRLVDKKGIQWKMHKEDGLIHLQVEFPAALESSIKDQVSNSLSQFNLHNYPELLDLPQAKKGLHYTLSPQDLEKWLAIFSEKNITAWKRIGTPPAITFGPEEKLPTATQAEIDETLENLLWLKSQRHASSATEEKVGQLMELCLALKSKASLDDSDLNSLKLCTKSAKQLLLTFFETKKLFLKNESIASEALSAPQPLPPRKSLFHPPSSGEFAPSPKSPSTGKDQFYHLTFQKSDTGESKVNVRLTEREGRSNIALSEKDKGLNMAYLLAHSLPDDLRHYLQAELNQSTPKASLTALFKKILDKIKKNYHVISKESIAEVLAFIVDDRPDFDPNKIAEDLYKTYKRNSEQLDPYKKIPDGIDPYESQLYFPSDLFIRIAVHHVDTYVRDLADQEKPSIPISKAWDPHYVEAVELYCRMRGYDCQNKSGWHMDQAILEEKHQYFEDFFKQRYKDLPSMEGKISPEMRQGG